LKLLRRSSSDRETLGLHPEDGGRISLWNAGILPHHFKASHPRRSRPGFKIC